ncbi:MAG: helix-turn-helix transcriptional regulator [Lachnospiraceae bacterium]|nr:helix-turn-helix transcriptional regulator [Lachnospiraceae bacterium]
MSAENTTLHSFSARLQGLLKERHIKKTDFAKEIGIAATTLSGYLSEKHSPDLDTLTLICDKLGVSTDYLLGRTQRQFMDSSTFTKPESEMIVMYKQLSENRQYEAMGEIRMLLKAEKAGK